MPGGGIAVGMREEGRGGSGRTVGLDDAVLLVGDEEVTLGAVAGPVPQRERYGALTGGHVDEVQICLSLALVLEEDADLPVSGVVDAWMGTPWQPPTPGNFTDSELSSPRSILLPATVMDVHSLSSLLIE